MFGGFKIQQCIEMSPTSPGEDSDRSSKHFNNYPVVMKRKSKNLIKLFSLTKRQILTFVQILEVGKRHSRGAFEHDLCFYFTDFRQNIYGLRYKVEIKR